MADARILVVDDREANVRLLERMLETAGVTQVHTLTDPRRPSSRCLELEPDLLLLDLHMPHLDGVAVLTALRAALPDGVFLPVIVLTADLSSDAKERALAAGAKDFLAKPLDRTEVLLRVGNLLETRALYARAASQHASADRARRAVCRATPPHCRVPGAASPHRARLRRRCAATGVPADREPRHRRDRRRRGARPVPHPPQQPPNEWFAEAAEVGLGVELELAAIDRALEQLPELGAGCSSR